jgi:hypothetical protein
VNERLAGARAGITVTAEHRINPFPRSFALYDNNGAFVDYQFWRRSGHGGHDW